MDRRWLRVTMLALILAFFCRVEAALADNRIALVIGNSNYANTPTLQNPGNDAADVGKALGDLGFKVTLRIDATKRNFDQALAQFSRDARTADAALIYFAGHGLQFQGRNYLMPIDAELEDEISLRYEMVAVEDLKEALQASSGVKILVLDSCRDNPLAQRLMRSVALKTRGAVDMRGLAPPERTSGILIEYATEAGDVAADGTGRNSPFADAFTRELAVPGLEVDTLFRRVGAKVIAATGGRQRPEMYNSGVSDYYLNTAETDQMIWAKIRDSQDPAVFRDFLGRYPGSFFAHDAANRIDLLELAKKSEGKTPPPQADAGRQETHKDDPKPQPTETPQAKPPLTVATLTPPATQPTPTPPPDLVPPIRAELRRLGCYSGADLEWDAAPIKNAVAKYARYASLAASPVAPDESLLEDLTKRPVGFCTPACLATQIAVGGQCVTKTCPQGEILSGAGVCVAKPVVAIRPPPKQHAKETDDVAPARTRVRTRRPALATDDTAPARPRAHAHEGSGKCFAFNGNQFCE